MALIGMVGKVFGSLTVLEEVSVTTKHRRFKVKCSCGTVKFMFLSAIKNVLKSKGKSPCNCGERKPSIDFHKEYFAWSNMKTRCYNPKATRYKDWGGRGITVCKEWVNDFYQFLYDVGEAPGPEYSIDRYPDHDGNYEPGNVRWATQYQQQNNRRI